MMSGHKFFSVFMLTVITIMITVAFVFWGIGPKDNNAIEFVADIEGDKIALNQYWRAYDAEYKRLRDQDTKPEDIDKAQLGDRVLGRMIDRKVLMIAATKAGVSVTERELQEAIINTEYFQKNGVFDQAIYERALKLNRLSPLRFEESLMEDLIITKMSRLIGETAELSPEELKILESIQGGNKEQLTEVFRSSKSNQTIKAYIESIKRKLDITVNRDLIT